MDWPFGVCERIADGPCSHGALVFSTVRKSFKLGTYSGEDLALEMEHCTTHTRTAHRLTWHNTTQTPLFLFIKEHSNFFCRSTHDVAKRKDAPERSMLHKYCTFTKEPNKYFTFRSKDVAQRTDDPLTFLFFFFVIVPKKLPWGRMLLWVRVWHLLGMLEWIWMTWADHLLTSDQEWVCLWRARHGPAPSCS